MRIGIYGGTFDPIHHGHLNLALEILEKNLVDEIWFIPARQNPLKNDPARMAIPHRLEMLKLALEGLPRFKIVDKEANRLPPSYTIDTLREILEENPSHSFYLILGEDSIPGFSQWKEAEEIVKLVPLLIGSRSGQWTQSSGNRLIDEAIKKGLIQTRKLDISSTLVRQRLADGLYCRHLVPGKVMDYISQFNLYY